MKVTNLIFNNFSLFILIVCVLLISNPVLTFKIANDFDVTNAEISVFKRYLKTKKIEKIEIKKNNPKTKLLKKVEGVKEFEKVFDIAKRIENFKKLQDKIYWFLGLSILLLVFKFFKKVRI